MSRSGQGDDRRREEAELQPALYICPTPIGNLQDITLRVLDVLRKADLVAAEDTRRTRALLSHYAIRKPVLSCHEHNEVERAAEIAETIKAGRAVALVSDAGTPGLSDPGQRLVRHCYEEKLRVVPLPGPSAVTTALSCSGLPAGSFRFGGFLPRTCKERLTLFERLRCEEVTLVFFESPHRVVAALQDVAGVFAGREVVVARELTKVHEEIWRGTAQEVWERARSQPPRGEFVILIGGAESAGNRGVEQHSKERTELTEGDLVALVESAISRGLSKKEAIRDVAERIGLSRRHVYAAATAIDAAREDDEDEDEGAR